MLEFGLALTLGLTPALMLGELSVAKSRPVESEIADTKGVRRKSTVVSFILIMDVENCERGDVGVRL